MFRSLSAAEKAALEGEGQDWDTQQCVEMQDEVLSSSPSQPPKANAVEVASKLDSTLTADPRTVNVEVPVQHIETEKEDVTVIRNQPPPDLDAALSAVSVKNATGQTRRLGRNSNSSLPLDEFEHLRDPKFKEILRQKLKNMDDLTQKSSLSLTQANSASVYEQYDLQKSLRNQVSSAASPGDAEDPDITSHQTTVPESIHSKQYASTRTESTGHTYATNDSRRVRIEFNPEPADEEMEELQDNSDGQVYEPQTPAPQVNPFAQKGSVMKMNDLFGATQPSSIGRHLTSPTSSRPSPDVFNYSSPAKRQRLNSSPLGGQTELVGTSPLQSSVRNLLVQAVDSPQVTAPRTSEIQSFDTGPRSQRIQSKREPRPYVSMKESQERRRGMSSASACSDSEESDSDIEAIPRRRKRDFESQIHRELSLVGKRTSSRPSSDHSAVVEVPSTGRRRSLREDYLAQCEGSYARDTQPDDFIADSQTHHESENADGLVEAQIPKESSGRPGTSPGEPSQLDNPDQQNITDSSEPRPANDGPVDLGHDADQDLNIGNSEDEDRVQQPSLPLQELSSNKNNLQTPATKKTESILEEPETVPETSPPEARLRPMSEIATISFGNEDDMADIPGFTQDPDFDHAIELMSPRSSNVNRTRKELGTDLDNSISSSLEPLAKIFPTERGMKKNETSSVPPSSLNNGVSKPQRTRISLIPATKVPSISADLKDIGNIGSALLPLGQETKSVADFPHNKSNESLHLSNSDQRPEIEIEDENEHGVENERREGSSDVANGQATQSPLNREGLRRKTESKGISQALRPSAPRSSKGTVLRQYSTKKSSTFKPGTGGPSKRQSSTLNASATPQTPKESHMRVKSDSRSLRRQAAAKADEKQSLASSTKRTAKRKLAATIVENEYPALTRSSRRHSIAHSSTEGSEDPLVLPGPSSETQTRTTKQAGSLFNKMAFAVSYVRQEQEKHNVIKLIIDNGGQILQDGFDTLFESSKSRLEDDSDLILSPLAKTLRFAALVADEHSRKAKYIQALALGLACVSGRWIINCVSKGTVVDWSPYLLCAGQSTVLGNALKSRVLQPYSAVDAIFSDTFKGRDKLLKGKSILLVTGKGKVEEKRKAYAFLTRALGPSRIGQVVDLPEARKELLASEQVNAWDLLYVDDHEKAAESAVFGPVGSSGGSRKRKRGPTAADDVEPTPKRVRVISDEIMVQSLIFGRLLDD